MNQIPPTLTKRQQQVLDTISNYIVSHGMPPTRSELAALLNLRAASTVEQHLQALAQKGYLTIKPGINRNIQITDLGLTDDFAASAVESFARPNWMAAEAGLPLVGRVAAGAPILAAEHVDAHYRIDPQLFHPEADYLLRVRGMSMRDAGILEGDLLAVHKTPIASNGEVVIARLDDEVTVKRFERHGRMVLLKPENPDFSPIEIDLEIQPLTIEGIAVGVIRNERF